MTEKTIALKEIFDKKLKEQWFKNPKKRAKSIETGFLNTKKVRCSRCSTGFTYRYGYTEAEKRKYLASMDFQELRSKVKRKNLEWKVSNHNKALKTAKEIGLPLIDLK